MDAKTHILIPAIYEYVTLPGKGELADWDIILVSPGGLSILTGI